MNDLDKLCKAPSAGLTLDQLMARCNSYSIAWWELSGLKIGMIIAGALLLGLLVLIDRLREEEDDPSNPGKKTGLPAHVTVLNTVEALLYGGLAVWAGSSSGAILALMLSPRWLGLMLAGFAVLALLMMIGALSKGTGGNKGLGAFAFLGLIGSLFGAALFAFQVPDTGRAGDSYGTYLTVMTILFACTAWVGAWIVTIYRGYHWAIGWLLVPLNASWGMLGNVLGLMNHLACLFFYPNSGDVQDKRYIYVLYKDGFHLKSGYDFTLGDAMSSNKVETHESIHVYQHFLFGPIYPLSYGLWTAVLLLWGVIRGAWKRTVGDGITDHCYYNCPWEVIAYAWQGRRNDGNTTLIWGSVFAWIMAIIWVSASTIAAIMFMASRS